MGLFDFLFGPSKEELKRREEEQRRIEEKRRLDAEADRRVAENRRREEERIRKIQEENDKFLFSKSKLEKLIQTLCKISYLFKDSIILKSTGGGRNEKMMSRTFSYVGILGYIYEVDYKYGYFSSIVDDRIATHYLLVKNAMSDSAHYKTTIKELSDNWSDVLQVIYNLQLEPNPQGDTLKTMKGDIDAVTSAFEKLSGKKCKAPIDPRNVKPRVVTYNPLNITEDPVKSQGHCIPDITEVFAQELLPQIIYAREKGEDPKNAVASYAVSMIKSYYDNAGFVPMCIVEQITGQINQVANMVGGISYAPHKSLKEYILSQIYK